MVRSCLGLNDIIGTITIDRISTVFALFVFFVCLLRKNVNEQKLFLLRYIAKLFH